MKYSFGFPFRRMSIGWSKLDLSGFRWFKMNSGNWKEDFSNSFFPFVIFS